MFHCCHRFTGWVVLLVAMLTVSLRSSVACDQDCREPLEFYAHNTGAAYYYSEHDCYYCGSGGCSQFFPVMNGDCDSVMNMTQTKETWSKGTPYCDDKLGNFVEGAVDGMRMFSLPGCPVYHCQKAVVPPGGVQQPLGGRVKRWVRGVRGRR